MNPETRKVAPKANAGRKLSSAGTLGLGQRMPIRRLSTVSIKHLQSGVSSRLLSEETKTLQDHFNEILENCRTIVHADLTKFLKSKVNLNKLWQSTYGSPWNPTEDNLKILSENFLQTCMVYIRQESIGRPDPQKVMRRFAFSVVTDICEFLSLVNIGLCFHWKEESAGWILSGCVNIPFFLPTKKRHMNPETRKVAPKTNAGRKLSSAGTLGLGPQMPVRSSSRVSKRLLQSGISKRLLSKETKILQSLMNEILENCRTIVHADLTKFRKSKVNLNKLWQRTYGSPWNRTEDNLKILSENFLQTCMVYIRQESIGRPDPQKVMRRFAFSVVTDITDLPWDKLTAWLQEKKTTFRNDPPTWLTVEWLNLLPKDVRANVWDNAQYGDLKHRIREVEKAFSMKMSTKKLLPVVKNEPKPLKTNSKSGITIAEDINISNTPNMNPNKSWNKRTKMKIHPKDNDPLKSGSAEDKDISDEKPNKHLDKDTKIKIHPRNQETLKEDSSMNDKNSLDIPRLITKREDVTKEKNDENSEVIPEKDQDTSSNILSNNDPGEERVAEEDERT
eukprot:g1137.t1